MRGTLASFGVSSLIMTRHLIAGPISPVLFFKHLKQGM
jgi:hypothetical protein